MNNQKRREILERLREHNPHPTTELNFNSPFELLIAVLLSAQATDVSVNKATDKLYPVANTPQGMLDLGVEGLKSYIKTIGLFNTKAENVIKTCAILLERHIAVDTHIFRVSNRTGFAVGKNVDQVEEKLLKVVPAEFKLDVHHWLILHGRYTCLARKPRCGSCIIEDLCEYKEKVYPES